MSVFSIISGKMHLTDPCYKVDPKNNCGVYNMNCFTGNWLTSVEYSN